jgi:hypothetical protein
MHKGTQFFEARYKRLPGDHDLKESHSICKECITTYLNGMNGRCKTKGKVPRKPSSNSASAMVSLYIKIKKIEIRFTLEC